MASIARKIAEAKSIPELETVIREDKLTEVEEGYCLSRLFRLTTSGRSYSQETEEEEDIGQYWMRAGSPVLSNSQNEVLEDLMDGTGGENMDDALRDWYRCNSPPMTYSQELILERAISEASKSESKACMEPYETENGPSRITGATKKGASPSGLSTEIVRGKRHYDDFYGESSNEVIEKGEGTMVADPQSPPTEVIPIEDDSEDDSEILIISEELPRQTPANQTPLKEWEIIDLTEDDEP